MPYHIIINGKHRFYNTKKDLVKDMVEIIKKKEVYKGMPKKERNIVFFANQTNVNLLKIGNLYEAKFIVETAGGELL